MRDRLEAGGGKGREGGRRGDSQRDCGTDAPYTCVSVCVCVHAWAGEVERVLHVAQKLVPNYSDFLINVSADNDGACGSSFLSLFFPLPRTHAQLARESAAIPDCSRGLGDID